MKLNQTHEEMIRSFAKTNKMSGPKLVDFAAQLFATVNIKEGKQVGRKASPEMLAIRNSVKDYLLSVGANKFTTIDITKAVGCSVAEANNTLTFYKNEFNISVIGKQEKEGKGKRPNLYQVCK